MTFAWPHLLWLLLAPAVFLVWELTRHRLAARNPHPKILQAEAGAHSLKLMPASAAASPSGARAHVWLSLGAALAIVALARPQWGRVDQPVFDQSREILIAIDLSKSMLTPDVKPSRLDRAKLLTQSLLEKLSGERVGLIVFSGTAFLQSPLSADYEILREFLPALNPAFLPEGGTNYDALLDTALDAFTADAAADRFLIVLSDGEATDEHWRDRLPDLKKRGIRVLGLGIGTAAGAMIPDEAGGFVKDSRGAVVMSKLESGTLRALVDASGGAYRDASGWVDLADLLNVTVEAGRKGKFLDKNTVRHVERFQWPLALALWFFFVSFCYEFPVRPKPRDLKLGAAPPPAPAPAPATAAGVSAIALLLAFAAASPRLRAADEPPAPPVSATALSKIVGRLADAAPEARTARDWAELAQETVTWGSRLQSAQQPVPAGPIHDALGAVGLGSKLDAKTADWPKLRSQLEDLLKQSEEQKQKQQQQDKDQQQKQDEQQKQNQPDKNQSGSPKDQQNQPQPQQQDSSQKPPPQNSPDQQKKSSDQQQQGSQPKPQPKDGAKPPSAFGDMKDQPPPPPKPSQETQKVGGVPPKKNADQKPVDPALALPMQKLEQLRNQDSPAELFQLMDADQKPAPASSNKKDW